MPGTLTNAPIAEDALRAVRDRTSLFRFLQTHLRWPVLDEGDDEAFTYEARQPLGLEETARISQIPPFGESDPFVLMLVEFQTDFKRTDLRKILQGIRQDDRVTRRYGGRSPEDIVFLCPTRDYQGVSFAHFEGREGRAPRLQVFGWEADAVHATRTLREINLPALTMPGRNLLGEYDWAAGKDRWLTAWDVERVTGRFYDEYKKVFDKVEPLIKGVTGDKRLFTQRLFNRLMFIQFLSKKRWLRFGTNQGGTDYLRALWEGRDRSVSFYTAHICPLFFAALNNPHIHRDLGTDSVLRSRIGQVPYLNGGLFQKSADEGCGESIPDAAFDLIINTLFARFNFTVHESTPLDIEVAVDPEMLGKVFEELVTGRHESGSYYTPRPVVAFMCKEALKGYLGGCEALVDHHDAAGVSVPQARDLLRRLAEVKVVDPACGSGAYLLGMLQELFALNRLLDTRAEQSSARDDYKRKLDIIRNNIYGVDLDDFAVQVARLRLWLSLAVEYGGAVPEPLPNLDFKVEQGDSLSSPDPQGGPTADMFRQDAIEEFSVKKARYADPYYMGDKAALKREIQTLRDGIAAWAHPQEKVQGFDWRVEFAEVFESSEPLTDLGGAMNFGGTLAEPARPGGFDIILANPPYVRQELIKEQKPTLAKVYPAVYVGTADLYCYFYARAVQLLRPGGMLAFISPNKWFRAGYGAKLKAYLAAQCHVESITDFGDLPVFQSATTYPMIFVAQKGGAGTTTFTQVKSLNAPYPDVLALIRRDGQRLPADAISGANWTLTDSASADRLRKMEKAGIPLGEYVNGQIYRGVLTGFNTAFVINGAKRAELIAADPMSAEIIKPLAMGRDIHKWSVAYRDIWLIFTRRGIQIKDYPAVEAHLLQWRDKLEPKPHGWDEDRGWQGRKPGSYRWYEIQDEVAYSAAFSQPKIMYQEIATYQAFAYDTHGAYVNNKVFLISTDDLYLLGVLNSAPAWAYLQETCSKLVGGALAMQTPYVTRLPIPHASDADRAAIAALVQKCLAARGVGCEAWEQEINGRVAALYGL